MVLAFPPRAVEILVVVHRNPSSSRLDGSPPGFHIFLRDSLVHGNHANPASNDADAPLALPNSIYDSRRFVRSSGTRCSFAPSHSNPLNRNKRLRYVLKCV